ncbi:MAG: hypothetical protein IKX00_02545 [Bacilli bacterium]|nr:hypothetical protein [Bacilli bacterium]
MISFYDNLNEEISLLSNNPSQEEITHFTINGNVLNDEAKLLYEKDRILLCFTHLNKENMDFIKYNTFRRIIDELSYNVDNLTTDYETLKKIIVHMELELSMNVLFSSTLTDILNMGLENLICYENIDNLTYGKLNEHYSKDRSKGSR